MSWPHTVGVLPRQADCFQHRDAIDALDAWLADDDATALCQLLTGMGGVGKTQLAAHHARRAWDSGDLDLLVWIDASSREEVVSGYAQAGAEILGADTAEQDQAAAAFLAWLGGHHGKRWLVVLDDVAVPSDIAGLWPPEYPLGRTLVTTRNRDAALLARTRHRIDVDLFTRGESLSYLKERLAIFEPEGTRRPACWPRGGLRALAPCPGPGGPVHGQP